MIDGSSRSCSSVESFWIFSFRVGYLFLFCRNVRLVRESVLLWMLEAEESDFRYWSYTSPLLWAMELALSLNLSLIKKLILFFSPYLPSFSMDYIQTQLLSSSSPNVSSCSDSKNKMTNEGLPMHRMLVFDSWRSSCFRIPCLFWGVWGVYASTAWFFARIFFIQFVITYVFLWKE